MFALASFLFVTTLLALSEQVPVEPVAAHVLAQPDHKIQTTAAKDVPFKTLEASISAPETKLAKPVGPASENVEHNVQNTENKKVSLVPKPAVKLPAVLPPRPAVAAVETKPAQHAIKARDVGASLQDDLLPSNGEEEPSAFGEGNSFEGRNRRIKVLPAFLG